MLQSVLHTLHVVTHFNLDKQVQRSKTPCSRLCGLKVTKSGFEPRQSGHKTQDLGLRVKMPLLQKIPHQMLRII